MQSIEKAEEALGLICFFPLSFNSIYVHEVSSSVDRKMGQDQKGQLRVINKGYKGVRYSEGFNKEKIGTVLLHSSLLGNKYLEVCRKVVAFLLQCTGLV